jgi:hypothetical protein
MSEVFAATEPKRMMLEAIIFFGNVIMSITYGYVSLKVCYGWSLLLSF